MEEMSTDNIHGVILAVSSSIFIGSSFIIKKKGLKKAGVSGARAGFDSLRAITYTLALQNCYSSLFN